MRLLASFTLVLGLLAAGACAQEFDDAVATLGLSAEDDFVITIEEGEPPAARGPGFRAFGRVTIGGFYRENTSTYAYESSPDFVQGYQDIWVDLTQTEVGFNNGGVDDINGNLSNTVVVLGPTGQNGELQPVAIARDFGDLHFFNMRFDTLNQRGMQRVGSIELMGQHLWDGQGGLLNERPAARLAIAGYGFGFEGGKLPVTKLSPLVEIESDKRKWYEGFSHSNYFAYGARFNFGSDEHYFRGISDVTGSIWSETQVDQYLVGPQVTLGRVVSKKRWMFDVSGSILVGYGQADFGQYNGFGDDAATGGVNNFFFIEPTYTHHETSEEDFAAYAEVRAVSSYLIKANWSVDLIARAFVSGPWYRSAQVVEYNMRDFGIGQPASDHLSGANLSLGVTYLR